MAKPNTFSLPDEKGQYSQPNRSDSLGDIFMSYGIDFDKGRIEVSSQVKKLVNNDDNATFSGYAGSIGAYSDKIFAVSDKAFSASINTPLGTWSEETAGSEPNSGNTVMDSTLFDELFLVSESTDIKAYNGTTWSSWWQGTTGQLALVSGDRHIIWTGSDGNLYIVDSAQKVYKVTPGGAVSKTGNGTLDFSATQYEITCAVTASTRSWIGTVDTLGENAVVVEWDMSPSASTANKLHKINAKAVRCIAIWNDVPVVVLSTGKVKYFNGVSFVDFNIPVEFPVPDGYELASDDEFIHPNGWAIIDDMPHFLVAGRVSGTDGAENGAYYLPSGVWCLDPSIGLYHRFALGSGLSTQEDYGQMRINQAGALYSLQTNDSKFLASYEYYDASGVQKSVLAYHDANNAQAARGFLMTSYKYSLRELWKKVELFHKQLASGEKIRVFSRTKRNDIIGKQGVWLSTSQFNITGVSLGITVGDMAFVKIGSGAGQLLRVSGVNESSSITTITFSDVNSFASTNDAGTLDFLNFRFIGEITDTMRDSHEFSVPDGAKSRKTQFLLEFQQAIGNTMEIDYMIVST